MVRPISSRFKEAIPTSRDHVVHRLGGERMGPYVHAAGGHYKTALALYRWNMTISAAFLELLSVTEVLARNALDEHLRVWCRRQGGNVEWLLHPDRIPTPLDKLFGSVAAGAYDKAQRAKEVRDKSATHARHQLPLTNGDILSQVTFGQWHTLFPWQEAEKTDQTTNGYRTTIWQAATKDAFTVGTDPDRIHWLLYRLAYFRNRVAHHECLLHGDLKNRLDDIFSLLRLVDPRVHEWATGHSRVTGLLRQRPG